VKGKSLTKPLYSLKSRIPIRAFSSSGERKKPGFRQIDTVHHCGQAAQGRCIHTLTAVHAPLMPPLNFFMPTQKLKSKTGVGSIVILRFHIYSLGR
jgi:hypothetical protein